MRVFRSQQAWNLDSHRIVISSESRDVYPSQVSDLPFGIYLPSVVSAGRAIRSWGSWVSSLLMQHVIDNYSDYNLTALDYIPKAGLKWVGNCNELNAGKIFSRIMW